MARHAFRRRGAAMTEAVVCVSLFAVLWAGLEFVFQVLHRKESAKAEARSQVWVYALDSCNEGTTETSEGESLPGVLADQEAAGEVEALPADSDVLIDNASQIDALEFGESWGVASVTVERPAIVAPAFVPNLSSAANSTTMRVQCDEQPRGTSPAAVLGFLWDLRDTLNLTQ